MESWSHGETNQTALVAARLGFEHTVFAGDRDEEDWMSGIGLVADLRY